MNLRDIQYFVAVADLGHFGKAAAQCHVSQPTLSMQLKKLEETLGVALFERSNRQVMLTAAGREVLDHARAVLASSERMVQAAKTLQDPLAGELTLGVFPTLAPYLLPLMMPALTKRLPRLHFKLVEEKTATLVAELESGRMDVALLAAPVASALCDHLPLFDESFFLAAPVGHALAQKKQVQLADLRGHPLLLLDEGHCLREQALEVCHRIGAEETDSFRATSMETLRQMVAAGSGITLVPRLAIQPRDKAIRYIPFTPPSPTRQIGLYFRKTSPKAALFRLLQENITAQLSRRSFP